MCLFYGICLPRFHISRANNSCGLTKSEQISKHESKNYQDAYRANKSTHFDKQRDQQ